MTADALRVRTFQFEIPCVKLAGTVHSRGVAGELIGRQLMRCGTSVGANDRAEVRARSRNEFIAKLGIVEEACDETLYGMEVILELGFVQKKRLGEIQREANELLAITVSSIKTARRNEKFTKRK